MEGILIRLRDGPSRVTVRVDFWPQYNIPNMLPVAVEVGRTEQLSSLILDNMFPATGNVGNELPSFRIS